jgi:thioredoxin 1
MPQARNASLPIQIGSATIRETVRTVRSFPPCATALPNTSSRFLPDANARRCGVRKDAKMSEIKYVSDASFEQDVLKSDGPVLVDYWAEWCGPCKMIAPILDEVSKEYGGKLTVAKMNVDDNQATPAKFGIRGIPTLMLFKNGAVVGTKVGALSKSQLTAFIDSNL